MPLCTLHYRLTYPEYREALRAAGSLQLRLPRNKPRWGLLLLFALPLTIVALASIPYAVLVNASWIPKNLDSPQTHRALVLLLVLFPFLFVLFGRWVVARTWAANPHLTHPHTLIVTETDLTESWDTTRVEIAWIDIQRLHETPNTLLLITYRGIFILPKSAISPADLLTLHNQFTTTRPTHAFPTLPLTPQTEKP